MKRIKQQQQTIVSSSSSSNSTSLLFSSAAPPPLLHHRQVFPIGSKNNNHDDNNNGILVDDTNEEHVRRRPLGDHNEHDYYNGHNAERLLSSKLNNLSMEERTRGIHELHGVATSLDEEDNNDINNNNNNNDESSQTIVLESKLKEMTEIILASSSSVEDDHTSETAAYRLAVQTNPKYVQQIKLLCLRADHYNPQKAANRVVSFFTFKQGLFGNESLTRDVTIDDFDKKKEDKEALNSGMFQLLQEKDRAGRAIIMFVGRIAAEYRLETVLRVLYYIHMMALRDRETQTKGVVTIFYMLGQNKFHSDRPSKHARSLLYIPIRIVAMHVCYDNQKTLMDLAVKMFCHTIESRLLCRFRGHRGSYLECMYNLMTFGIPKHILPIDTETGEVRREAHLQWLNIVHAKEQRSSQQLSLVVEQGGGGAAAAAAANVLSDGDDTGFSSSATSSNEIVIPGKMDIIVGRGSLSKSSAGYLRMRNLVEDRYEAYESADKTGKTAIARLVLKDARMAGCRFVRFIPEEGGLVECDDGQSRSKIAHAFRNLRRTMKNNNEKATTSSRSSTDRSATSILTSKKRDRPFTQSVFPLSSG